MLKRIKSHYLIQQFARRFRPLMPARVRWRDVWIASAKERPRNDGRVLIATSTGSHWAMSGFESVIAAALKLRGAQVDALLCDGVLSACQECDLRILPTKQLLKNGPAVLCKTCFQPAKKMFSELDMVVHGYGDWITQEDKEEISVILRHALYAEGSLDADGDPSSKKRSQDDSVTAIKTLQWRGIPVGEHAYAGALRYFGRGDLNAEPDGIAVLRRYLQAALLATASLQNLFRHHKYDVVVFHHGIYVPQGIVGDVCRQLNIRVVNWHPAYRKSSYLFSHGDTYHKTMIEEPCEQWENIAWNDQKESAVMQYLDSRRTGSQDWISFQRSSDATQTDLQALGLDIHRPIIGLLTNVMWDAQLHFRHNAFSSMLEWLLYTINYFSKRSDLQLLIRVHPAEVLGGVPSRQRVEDEIKKHFPQLSSRIAIVGSNSTLNTYALMQACDTVLVYGTKMAFELPCFSKPVVVAGEAWARGKGFTIDVSSKEEYQQVLDTLPRGKVLDEKMTTRARQYAYHLFYRRMIPVKFARKFPRLVPFAYDVPSLDVISQGADKGLDAICHGILTGEPFVYE